jgi:hypothetical protein
MSDGPVIIGGFGGSGSSALVDLLREMDDFHSIIPELRFLTDPDGVLSLETALGENWSPYQSDRAIKRFMILIRHLSRKGGYPYANQDFNRSICPSFERLSLAYAHELVGTEYKGMWVGINDPFSVIFRKFAKFLKSASPYGKSIFLSKPLEEFHPITKRYLRSILDEACPGKRAILDEGYASLYPARLLRLFDDARMIIVSRDPRDTYTNAIKYSYVFAPRNVDGYIDWYRSLMRKTHAEADPAGLLRITFEELVLEYEATTARICGFLEIPDGAHAKPKAFFDPAVSKKNIGLWKKHPDAAAMEKIGYELKEYCYADAPRGEQRPKLSRQAAGRNDAGQV